ncbi:Melanocyte-stimulating hormone receptor [Frankliniella fusca]|uniref:Melanocyte-stimulating hormone receptor n=1 Tax=Frankliniella fusca TaxID=407009 RepID=A0AAE1GXF5_9NEOP|nr:Melanocyte-stimulating hormone receptor [Frankliniella fusca]
MLPLPLVRSTNPTTSDTQLVCLFAEDDMKGDAAVLRTLLSVQFIVAVTIVLVNVYTIAAIWPRRKRRSTQSQLFVLHLAFADVLCGASKLLLVIFSADCTLAHMAATCEWVCVVPCVITMFTWTLSATTLAAIAVDRYVCIVHSLRYYEFMNTRRVLLILAALWVFSMLCAGLYLPTWSWQEGRYCDEQNLIPFWHVLAVQIPMTMLVLVVVAVTHITIRSEAQRHVARRSPASWGPGPGGSSSASVRSAKITILVVASFVLCYLPMQIFQVLVNIDREDFSNWDFFMFEMFSSLWYLLNPFIYAWKNASIREDMVALWRRLFGRCMSQDRDALEPPMPPPGARRF